MHPLTTDALVAPASDAVNKEDTPDEQLEGSGPERDGVLVDEIRIGDGWSQLVRRSSR